MCEAIFFGLRIVVEQNGPHGIYHGEIGFCAEGDCNRFFVYGNRFFPISHGKAS